MFASDLGPGIVFTRVCEECKSNTILSPGGPALCTDCTPLAYVAAEDVMTPLHARSQSLWLPVATAFMHL